MFNTEVFSVNMQYTYTIEAQVYPNQCSTECGPTLSNLNVEAPYFSEMLVSTRCQNTARPQIEDLCIYQQWRTPSNPVKTTQLYATPHL
jgi:hypothetical protein